MAAPKLNYFHFNFFNILHAEGHIHDPYESQLIDDERLSYEVFYYGERDLRIFPVASFSENDVTYFRPLCHVPPHFTTTTITELPIILGKGIENAWNVFYEYAYFDFIILAMTEEYKLGPTVEDDEIANVFGLRNKESLYDYEAFRQEDLNAEEADRLLEKQEMVKDRHVCADSLTYSVRQSDRSVLELIRDKPRALDNQRIRERLEVILSIARWSTDRKRRNQAKSLLEECLFPRKHQGGRTPILDAIKIKLAFELLKRLAAFTSKKCRKGLKELGIEKKDIKLEGTIKELIDWLHRNKEFRLDCLAEDSLFTLISSPIEFADKFTTDHLHISKKDIYRACKRTLSRTLDPKSGA